jgi:TM2 domain-containing membrane protein YozV
MTLPNRSNPLLASLLSTIVPGSGQLYNGETKKGWLIIGSCLSLALLTYGLQGFHRISPALALLLLWVSAIADAYKVAQCSGQGSDFYYRRPYVVAMLLFVGPLALPLLWQSPHFSRTARWIWTAIVVGAAVLFVTTPYLVDWLIKQTSRA